MSGTVYWLPREMVTSTVVPITTVVPALGELLITLPFDQLAVGFGRRHLNRSASRTARACDSASPLISGMVTILGPVPAHER